MYNYICSGKKRMLCLSVFIWKILVILSRKKKKLSVSSQFVSLMDYFTTEVKMGSHTFRYSNVFKVYFHVGTTKAHKLLF